MSLFMPVSADKMHSRPMAISTITSPTNSLKASRDEILGDNIEPSNNCQSPSAQFTKSDIAITPTLLNFKASSLSPESFSSSNYSTWSAVTSPNSLCTVKFISKSTLMCRDKSSLTQTSINERSPYSSYNYRKKISTPYDVQSKSTSPDPILSDAPLSLQERRTRNKTASAKYRAKKNQQHNEMRAMIASLTKENELLIRQLENLQYENNHLRDNCDKLRGKIMAQKMLKQFLGENKPQGILEDNIAA